MANTAVGGKAASTKQMGSGMAVLILLIGTACLAFSGIWVKGSNFEPATSVVLRCWIPLIIFLPFFIWEGKRKGFIPGKAFFWAALAGFILGIDFTAWNFAIFYVGAGIASVLLNMQVIILPVLAFLIDKERIVKSYWIVLPIMIVGIALVGGVLDDPLGVGPLFGAGSGDDALAMGPTELAGMPVALLGTLLGCVSGVCYGLYLYSSRKSTLVAKTHLGGNMLFFQPIAVVSFFQGLPPLIFMLLRGDGFHLSQGVLVDGNLPADAGGVPTGDMIDGWNWAQMIMLAVLGQFIAWTFVQIGSVNMEPTISAGLLLLSPVSTIFIAAAMFSEIPSILQVIGVVMVLGAVAYQNGLFEFFRGKKPSDHEAVTPHEEVFEPHLVGEEEQQKS